MSVKYTLLSDGPSDRALIPHLTWLLETNGVKGEVRAEWAELRNLRDVPKGLEKRVAKAIELYPCELLFVHRDAERETLEARRLEVNSILAKLKVGQELPVFVCVVPVRMQEAWLLCDEAAIRRAAGNPNGAVSLDMPKPRTVEQLPDPKEVLNGLLRIASESTGRRLKQFNVSHSSSQVSQYIEDFSLLRAIRAFRLLEDEVRMAIEKSSWSVE